MGRQSNLRSTVRTRKVIKRKASKGRVLTTTAGHTMYVKAVVDKRIEAKASREAQAGATEV